MWVWLVNFFLGGVCTLPELLPLPNLVYTRFDITSIYIWMPGTLAKVSFSVWLLVRVFFCT